MPVSGYQQCRVVDPPSGIVGGTMPRLWLCWSQIAPLSLLLQVVRSWEKSDDGTGLILRFNLTNTAASSLKLGGLGFPMPQAGMQHGIEESVWLDPHVGGDHGFVEWVRVVVDEQTMLATAEQGGAGMEAWRPLLEGCSSDNWEWTVHSEAWAAEWKENKQFPYLAMAGLTLMEPSYPEPHKNPTIFKPKCSNAILTIHLTQTLLNPTYP